VLPKNIREERNRVNRKIYEWDKKNNPEKIEKHKRSVKDWFNKDYKKRPEKYRKAQIGWRIKNPRKFHINGARHHLKQISKRDKERLLKEFGFELVKI